MFSISDVRAARERIAGKTHVTPTMSATRIGERAGVRLFLKCENFQKTGSFKARGALNKLSQLDADARARGVVTFSAGNHAQSLAWASRAAGVQGDRRDARRGVAGQGRSESRLRRRSRAARRQRHRGARHGATSSSVSAGLTFVHPFDDEFVAAGQGTAALELARAGA